jgi:hypothetical protein
MMFPQRMERSQSAPDFRGIAMKRNGSALATPFQVHVGSWSARSSHDPSGLHVSPTEGAAGGRAFSSWPVGQDLYSVACP